MMHYFYTHIPKFKFYRPVCDSADCLLKFLFLFTCPPVRIKLIKHLEVHGSMHRNIKLIERTNKMQLRSRIYYSNVS